MDKQYTIDASQVLAQLEAIAVIGYKAFLDTKVTMRRLKQLKDNSAPVPNSVRAGLEIEQIMKNLSSFLNELNDIGNKITESFIERREITPSEVLFSSLVKLLDEANLPDQLVGVLPKVHQEVRTILSAIQYWNKRNNERN